MFPRPNNCRWCSVETRHQTEMAHHPGNGVCGAAHCLVRARLQQEKTKRFGGERDTVTSQERDYTVEIPTNLHENFVIRPGAFSWLKAPTSTIVGAFSMIVKASRRFVWSSSQRSTGRRGEVEQNNERMLFKEEESRNHLLPCGTQGFH